MLVGRVQVGGVLAVSIDEVGCLSHASAETSAGEASAKKSTGKAMTRSTTRVMRTLPTSHDIVPTLPAEFQRSLRLNR